MNDRKKIHNIVASTVLANAMCWIKHEFMFGIRGYLCTKPEDDKLFARAERAARNALESVLLEDNTSCGPFTKDELKIMSNVFHDYKDYNRGIKESILPVMELEKKLTELTGGAYEPDTTYDIK